MLYHWRLLSLVAWLHVCCNDNRQPCGESHVMARVKISDRSLLMHCVKYRPATYSTNVGATARDDIDRLISNIIEN